MPIVKNSLEKIIGKGRFEKWKETYNSPLIANGLIKVLGEERFEKIKYYRWKYEIKLYDAAVGALALNTFSYAVAFPYEKLIGGLSWGEHLFTRGIAFFTNTSTERFYEKIRVKVFKKLNISEETPVKKYITDTFLFIGLQVPLHWTNMAIGIYLRTGKLDLEDVKKMALASLTMIPIGGLLGGPYGRYLDKTRKLCGLPIEYVENKLRAKDIKNQDEYEYKIKEREF